MSRLESSLNVAQATAVESANARGRIMDADIAQESAELVRLNILQQTSAAILAQANLQPQVALSLLSGS